MQRRQGLTEQFKTTTSVKDLLIDGWRVKTQPDELNTFKKVKSYKKFCFQDQTITAAKQHIDTDFNNQDLRKFEVQTSDFAISDSFRNITMTDNCEANRRDLLKKTKSLGSIRFISELSQKQLSHCNIKNHKIIEKRCCKFNLKTKNAQTRSGQSITESKIIYNEFTSSLINLNTIIEKPREQEQENGQKYNKKCSNCYKNIRFRDLCKILIKNVQQCMQKIKLEQEQMITEIINYKDSIVSQFQKQFDLIKQNLIKFKLQGIAHQSQHSLEGPSLKLEMNQFVKQISHDIQKLMTKLVNDENVIKRLHVGKIVKNKIPLVFMSHPQPQISTINALKEQLNHHNVNQIVDDSIRLFDSQNCDDAAYNAQKTLFAQNEFSIVNI